MILVTGSTGNVGAYVCEALARSGAEYRRAVTQPTQQPDECHLDFLDQKTYETALNGIKRVFLVRPPALAKPQHEFLPFLTYCKEVGIEQVVFLSLQGADKNGLTPHAKIENLVGELGLPFTFLRPSFFMQNLTMQHRQEIQQGDCIFMPAGNGRTNFIDVRDIAEVAAIALTQPNWTQRAVELTGAESFNYDEVAALLSEQLQRKITYKKPGIARYMWQTLRKGTPFPFVLVTTAIYTIARLGKADHYSPELQSILGKAPRTLASFIREYRDLWQKM